MTLDELIEWHTRRIGAKLKYEPDTGLYLLLDKNGTAFDENPFSATLDAADASFPPNWRWTRDWNDCEAWWAAYPRGWDGEQNPSVQDTGDKIRDLYELSMKAWEQEAA